MSTPPSEEPLNPSPPSEPTDAAPSSETPFASERIGVAHAPPTHAEFEQIVASEPALTPARADTTDDQIDTSEHVVTTDRIVTSEPVDVTEGTTILTPTEAAAETVAVVEMTPAEPIVVAPDPVEPTVVAPIGPTRADEPAVTDVAPLAVATTAAAARVAPIVVKTRTGPVALDEQPPAPVVERPAPIAIRETVAAPTFIPRPARLASLDIFRGITIAMMMLVNNQPGEEATHYAPLEHATWHGWTPTDLVFPFFLFIVGVATPFSLLKRSIDPLATRGSLLGHIWLRALSLMLLGWLLGGTNLPWPFPGTAPGVWLTERLQQDASLLPDLAPPAGFIFTKILRGVGFVFAFGGVLALLVPWRSRRMQTIVPLATLGLLLAYCVAMHFVRATALANGWPEKTFGSAGLFNPDKLRIPGVLVRIGICYGVAASIALVAGRKTIVLAIVALFAIYSVLMLATPFAGHTVGSLTKVDNFAHSVDVALLQHGHLDEHGKRLLTQDHAYGEYADNEGVVSTLPAIGTALIGVLAGLWLRSVRPAAERCAGLLAWGVATTCAGVLLSWWLMPINKNLWTPSFTVFTAGLAMLGLGLVFYVADVRGRRAWAWPFKVFGMNAIAAFVASTVIARLSKLFVFVGHDPTDPSKVKTFSPVGWLDADVAYRVGRAQIWLDGHGVSWLPLNTPQNTSLAGALCFVAIVFALMLVLYVCRIFVKV